MSPPDMSHLGLEGFTNSSPSIAQMSVAATISQPVPLRYLNQHPGVKLTRMISPLHQDIVTLVFAEFNTSDPAERAACAQGALVCRAWAEPALRALWRSLRSLLPLYAVLLPVPRTVRKTYIGRWYIEYIGEASFYFLLNQFR